MRDLLHIARQFNPNAQRVEFLRQSHNAIYRVACADGRLILPTELDGQAHFVTAFSWAEGRNWDERCDYEPEKLVSIGRELGKIHRLSKAFTPAPGLARRPWHESQHLLKAPALFQAYSAELRGAFGRFMREMRALPRESAMGNDMLARLPACSKTASGTAAGGRALPPPAPKEFCMTGPFWNLRCWRDAGSAIFMM